MSAVNIEALTQSAFQFNVGPEGKAFFLHSKLVSRHSSVFHALMSGHMKEAEEGKARLSNVDEHTFARFAEFIYGGNYNADEALIVLDDAEPESETARSETPKLADEVRETSPVSQRGESPNSENWARPKKKDKRKRGDKILIRRHLESFSEFAIPSIEKVSFPEINISETESDTGLTYDYTEALCHVRLYVFAEQYQIHKLKDLVLCRLHSALQHTTFHPVRTGELCDMISLAYENTPELKEEPLRDLLTHYVAWKFEDLAPTKEFKELFIGGGMFVNDLCQKVSLRL
ncbi:BTB/POZ domain-containing protein [Cladophialophora immunda]|nr:BTB/POZ domain-containing protein [Cladophialophora immunda]